MIIWIILYSILISINGSIVQRFLGIDSDDETGWNDDGDDSGLIQGWKNFDATFQM